jgi:integrase
METNTTLQLKIDKAAWGDAIQLWLASRRSEATRRAYAKALEDLLLSSGKAPYEINRTDVRRWTLEMEKRGNAPATVAMRLAAVSSFFEFTSTDYYTDGSQTALGTLNPAAGKSLRPDVETYGKASWLQPEEAKALLKAIRTVTLQGKRDYALFLGYIFLARRNSEWRKATWGDFQRRGDQVFLRWDGKHHTDQHLEVPLPVWNAVGEYLRAAGRLKEMKAEDCIFTAIRCVGKKMPNGAQLQPNQAICSHEVGRLLKRYLAAAGLTAGRTSARITPHSLRHTGAMLRRQAGASDQEIMEFLGHANLAITQVYLHTLDGHTDSHWMTVSELLGLEIGK